VVVVVSGLALPQRELINRRKSPALWREDLCNEDEEAVKKKPKRLLTRPPEVMSPVGGFPQLYAAIGNGADSVYLGLSAFSARARAANFDPITELPTAVKAAHDARVKVYVALNTLVFDNELHEVEGLVHQCIDADVDALIVQDLGVARLAQTIIERRNSRMEVHASTQQTITSADGAAFCEEVFGTQRVVLGRELSTAEIDTVSKQLEEEHPDVELEAFVHGALCVSYSGQCFSSEAWGGRSANRGQCAQACRLPYGLIDNGELVNLGDFSYLLSPQDLCGIEQVPQLLESNVQCLKIEGRLKDEAYVAATTRAYRNAVDKAWEDYCEKYGIDSQPTERRCLESPEDVSMRELAQIFSRGQDEIHDGLTPGFFEGSKHQQLVRGRSPRHRGIHVGRVDAASSSKSGLIVRLDDGDAAELKLGDGLVVDRGLAQEEELGGAIFDIFNNKNGQTIIHFSRDVEKKWRKYDDNARKVGDAEAVLAPKGAHVWKTSDAAVDKKMKRLVETSPPKLPVTVTVAGSHGKPLEISLNDGRGNVGRGVSDGCLEKAERSAVSEAAIQKAIGTLGNTPWTIAGDIDVSELEENLWCPVSWIKDARRHAVEDLESKTRLHDQLAANNPQVQAENMNVVKEFIEGIHNDDSLRTKTSKLSVLARNYEQVDALCQMVNDEGLVIDEIVVDFLEVEGMKEAVARIREANVCTVVATPRVVKPNESGIWRTLLRLEPDYLLVRSAGLLRRMMKLGGPGAQILLNGSDGNEKVKIPQLIGDFSLNVANALTAYELLEYGCSRVTASYDLGAHAITELLLTLGPVYGSRVEIVCHAHMPIFHTEHCVFARFLSNGNSYLDCGHACTRHNIHLRDETGKDNLVLADMGCRNTVFAAEAQSGVHSIHEWAKAGAKHFRIELVDESAGDVREMASGYREVMDGKEKPSVFWRRLENVKDSNGRKGSVSFGSFRNRAERRAGELT
jgi:collagenase-like PrtC family protease